MNACRFSRDHVVDVLKEQFCLVLNQFVYVGDVLGDTSPIIWQKMKKKTKFTPVGEGGSGR